MFVRSYLFVLIFAYNHFYIIEIIRAACSIIPATELTLLSLHMYLYSKVSRQLRANYYRSFFDCSFNFFSKSLKIFLKIFLKFILIFLDFYKVLSNFFKSLNCSSKIYMYFYFSEIFIEIFRNNFRDFSK